MTSTLKKTPVEGGWIARDAKTGQFVSVGTSKGVKTKSLKSEATIKEVSKRRRDALKRLVDR